MTTFGSNPFVKHTTVYFPSAFLFCFIEQADVSTNTLKQCYVKIKQFVNIILNGWKLKNQKFFLISFMKNPNIQAILVLDLKTNTMKKFRIFQVVYTHCHKKAHRVCYHRNTSVAQSLQTTTHRRRDRAAYLELLSEAIQKESRIDYIFSPSNTGS